MSKHLTDNNYKAEFIAHFPGDKSGDLRPRQTPGMLWSKAAPTPVKAPKLLAWSEALAKELGMAHPAENDVQLLGGNLTAPGMQPYAACYGGHQFGSWAGQLGDGRAITLGEWRLADDTTWELQLKGAGPTPYSRRADGRAVLRSSVREYLMSEAMHYLGVPTTRALSLVATGDDVLRDMFYDGNAAYEPGAIVMRAAPSFLRFGNFEILAARQESQNLAQLIDWTITKHYPHITGTNKIIDWFAEVVARTAKLMAEWLRVGFVHGVMNTDNMSILGLTIDYGPYSFLDDYDPAFTPNTTDLPGRRYAFGKQAAIAKWNLGCLGGAVATLLEDEQDLLAALNTYDDIFWKAYYNMMCNKLGLDELYEQDIALINSLEQVLATVKPDMTIFFQRLIDFTAVQNNAPDVMQHFENSFYAPPSQNDAEVLQQWISQYIERIRKNKITVEDALQRMRAANPGFILRNYLLHQAIEELEAGTDTLFKKLQAAMAEPYANKRDDFFSKRPQWAGQKAGCSMLSCSS